MNQNKSIDEYSKLISYSNCFMDAKEILINMKNIGISPTKYIYMVLLTKTTNMNEEDEVYVLMKADGIELPNQYWHIYRSKITNSKSFKEALGHINQMKKKGINPNKYIITVLKSKAITIEQTKHADSLLYSISTNQIGIKKVKRSSEKFLHDLYNKPISTKLDIANDEVTTYTTKTKRDYTHKNSKVHTYNLNDIKIKSNSTETNNSYSNKTTNIELQTNSHNETTEILIPNKKVENELENINIKAIGNIAPEKKDRTVTFTNRNISLVRIVKDFYENSCQICNEKIQLPNNQFAIEVHHIKPLGLHNGADISENMIVLCPNHHVMFDRGAISIDIASKTVTHFDESNAIHGKQLCLKHDINQEFVDYHNKYIFAKVQRQYSTLNDTNKSLEAATQSITYGNSVQLEDVSNNETFRVTLENKYNKEFLKPLEKKLIGKKVDDIIEYDCYRYKIISTES